ncbi:GNAT family N-acetyltransferase [Halovulum sp. GXIMD14793]
MGATTKLTTERLTLRSLHATDAAAIARGIGNVKVLRNLTSPPYPYQLSDAEEFIEKYGTAPEVYGLSRDGLIGVITLRPNCDSASDLGYWLAEEHWGNGYMTEAAQAVTARHFAASDEPIASGHVVDNAGSRNILRKLGFRDTHLIEAYIAARDETCPMQRMELKRADWDFICDPKIATERLILRPLTKADAPRISEMADDIEVVRMLGSVSHPFPVEEAAAWIKKRRFRGATGVFGIWAGDTMIGMTGMGDKPVSFMYWLHPDHFGKGYATEASRGFLAAMLPRISAPEVTATCFVDNPASLRVLEKLGFERHGESMGDSRARLEPAPVIEYRLSAEKLRRP